MDFKDYYAILGIAKNAETQEIKRAYRKLARKYHPDVSKEPDAEAKFKEINEAWEVLQDPEKRARYDQVSAGGWQGGRPFEGGGYRSYEQQGDPFGEQADFSEFFNSVFGGMHGRGFGGTHRQTSHRPYRQAGRDLNTKIEIPITTAYNGGVQSISLQVPTVTPEGHQTVQTKHLNIRIPKGVGEGSQIRLKGQGGEGFNGGPHGDLYIEIHILPDPVYSLVNRDLHVKLPITPWEAALGATVTVPTLGGPVNLKIPAGAKSNQQMRLKGRGMPGDPPGDQHVILEIMNPPLANDKDKALFEEMAKLMPFNPREKLGV